MERESEYFIVYSPVVVQAQKKPPVKGAFSAVELILFGEIPGGRFVAGCLDAFGALYSLSDG